MIIQSGNARIGSSGARPLKAETVLPYAGWGNVLSGRMEHAVAARPGALGGGQEMQYTSRESREQEGTADIHGGGHHLRITDRQENPADTLHGMQKIEFFSFRNMLEMLFGLEGISENLMFQEVVKKLERQKRGRQEEETEKGQRQTQGVSREAPRMVTWLQLSVGAPLRCEEEEDTIFFSSGCIITEDGQMVEFDMEADMSRNFTQKLSFEVDYTSVGLIDPLIINMKAVPLQIRDQTFYFDVDPEAGSDNLTLLAAATAEAPGKSARSPDILTVFRTDKNKWMDGRDEVFNRLRIWIIDEDGRERLIGLGASGIGIVYLGNSSAGVE